MRRILASSVCALALAACQDQLPTEPDVPEPAFDINDVHSGGAALNSHFAFRFPLRRLSQQPPAGEAFAGSMQPVLKICRWTSNACDSPESELTLSSGSAIRFEVAGQEVTVRRNGVVVLPELEAYMALWDSRTLRPTGSEVVENEIYRLRVFLGATELGFVDAKVWRTVGQLLQITRWNEANPTNPYFPLPRNALLPVPFWIGELAVAQAQSFALTLPASVVSGATASVTVTVRDADGGVATGYRGTVAFTSSDPDATLPPNYTFTAEDAGVHSFADAVSFTRAATGTTLRVTDVADPGIFGEGPLDVLPADAASLQLTGLGDPFGAGTTGSVTVTAHDANGNVATGYTGTIAFTSSDPQATLPAEYTFTSTDAGTHAFDAAVTLRTAGPVTVRAADNANPDIFGEAPVTVVAVSAATLRVTGLNESIVAGAAGSITVTARDPSGNLAADYTGTIAFTSTDPLATLPESYTFTPEDAGTHAFPAGVTLRTAGAATVTATDQTVATITGSQPVTVTPAAATTLALAGIPEQTTAGVTYELSVTARDQFGNTATGYGGTVQFSSTDPAAVLPSAYQFQTADAGVRAFPGVTFKTAGERTLQVTDIAAPAITVSFTTTVAPAAAAELRFTVQPSAALAGSPIAPPVVVTAYDPFGNLAAAFTGQVAVAIGTNPGGGVLSGTSPVAAVSGVATFADFSISAAGNGYTLVASAASLTGATSDPFNITAPAPIDVHWINPAGGNWSVASNWSTGAVPTADQNVFIDLAGTYTVTLNVNPVVRSLSLGAAGGIQSLVGATRTLTLTTSGTILSTGRMTLTNCTINGTGTLAIATGGVLTLSQGNTVSTAVDNAGSLLVGLPPFSSNATITGALTTRPGSLIQTQAASSNSSTLTAAAGFTNHGTIRLTKSGDEFGGSFLIVSSGTLINETDGLIQTLAGSGGGRTLTAQLDNRGTMELAQGLVINRAGAAHTNSGSIGLTAGTLTLSQSGTTPSFTNTGSITIAAASTWGISGGSFTQAASGTLGGGGAMSFTNVSSASFGTTFNLRALTLSTTTATFATDVAVGTGGWNLTSSTVNGPVTLTNPAGRTLSLINSTINTAVHNAGTLAAGVPPFANTSTINGTFTTDPGSLVRVQAHTSNTSTLTLANGFTNHGTITLTKSGDAIGGSILAVTTGTLVNAGDGTITSRVEAGSAGGRTLAAQLENQGMMNVLYPLTISRAGADHSNSGTIAVANGDLTIAQSGVGPSFTNSGTIDVAATRAMRIAIGPVTNGAGASIEGDGTFESGTAAAFNNAGNVTVGLMRVGDGLTSTGTFSPETVEFFGNPATIPVGAGYAYTHVRTIISASFAGSVSLAGDLTAAGPGNITIGAHEVTVGGNFATQGTSVLTMQNAAGILTVGGNASFGGATTNGRLTAGTFRLAGNFAQGGTSPAGYAATLNHVTVLNGAGAQSVSFANPGTSTTLSHFHRLEIQNSSPAGVTLGSAVFANGQLRTPAGPSLARTLSSAGHTLQVGGLNATGLVLDNTPLRVVNGEPLNAFDGAVFQNMNPEATQFRLDRSADVVTFNNLQFLVPPTTGLYLHLVDTDTATPVFTLTMQGTQPATHGGKVLESVAGQLLGWPAVEGGSGAAP